ncbi:MAG: hypothetical protein PHH90_10620 [Limnochordia bacterium]|jgi:hypothetical protein|nr:hypothetical protein [Limnochordia bacterium]
MGFQKRMIFGLVALLVVASALWISIPMTNSNKIRNHESDESSKVITYSFLYGSNGSCVSLINKFAEEFGVEARQEHMWLDKLITLVIAGNEFLPNLVIVSEKEALELAKTGALVNMEPLFAETGIDIKSLPPGNRLYPAVYEGEQLFLEISPGRVPIKNLLVGLLNRENLTEAFELAYYLATSDSKEAFQASYDLIWRGEFVQIVQEFFLPSSVELLYHNFLHPDLQEYWTVEQFKNAHSEILEQQFRYVTSAFPSTVKQADSYTSFYTGKEYDEVVEVEISLSTLLVGDEPESSVYNEELTYLSFTIVDGQWKLIL